MTPKQAALAQTQRLILEVLSTHGPQLRREVEHRAQRQQGEVERALAGLTHRKWVHVGGPRNRRIYWIAKAGQDWLRQEAPPPPRAERVAVAARMGHWAGLLAGGAP